MFLYLAKRKFRRGEVGQYVKSTGMNPDDIMADFTWWDAFLYVFAPASWHLKNANPEHLRRIRDISQKVLADHETKENNSSLAEQHPGGDTTGVAPQD